MTEVNGFKFDISKNGAILRSYTGDELDVVIPDTVTHIGSKAFDGCSKVTKIKVPNKIQTISNRCFAMCKSLEMITIPEKTRLIERDAFSSCSKQCKLHAVLQIYSVNSLLGTPQTPGLLRNSYLRFLKLCSKNLAENHLATLS